MTILEKKNRRKETTLTNPVEKRLEMFVSNLLTSTKDIEIQKGLDNIELRNILVEYMKKDKTGLKKSGWKMSVLRNIVYDLADYDSSQKDKFGVSIKNMTFENRVTRAIIDSVLLFNKANPDTKTKGGKVGYQLNDKGEMCLPFKTLQPTTKNKIKGVSQDVPNKDPSLVPINVELRRVHFGELFPEGTRKVGGKTGVTDYEKIMIELNTYLISLSNENLISLLAVGNTSEDKQTDFEKYLETLENTIGNVFTRKSSLVATTKGNVVDTKIEEVA
tara:strand:+ start:233 stop:1057 length:825 start_codon:yes stop_codon:yes gene_type:complete